MHFMALLLTVATVMLASQFARLTTCELADGTSPVRLMNFVEMEPSKISVEYLANGHVSIIARDATFSDALDVLVDLNAGPNFVLSRRVNDPVIFPKRTNGRLHDVHLMDALNWLSAGQDILIEEESNFVYISAVFEWRDVQSSCVLQPVRHSADH